MCGSLDHERSRTRGKETEMKGGGVDTGGAEAGKAGKMWFDQEESKETQCIQKLQEKDRDPSGWEITLYDVCRSCCSDSNNNILPGVRC